MTLKPSRTITPRDLDGAGINISQPGLGIAEALVGLVNNVDNIIEGTGATAANVGGVRAIDTTSLADGAQVVKLDDDSIWIFAHGSSAADDGVTVLQPTTGPGRFLLAASPSGAPGFGAAGTSTASKGLVLDANKSTDHVQATTDSSVGGTGVPGGAAVQTTKTKSVTAFSDTVAKAVFTATIPNATHAARIEVDVEAELGAGGAIGAGESTMATKYVVTLVRRAGLAVVAGVSAVSGAANAKVAGADDITSAVITTGNLVGANGASQTLDIMLAITKAAGASNNHTATVAAKVLNANATGITIA